MVELYNDDCIKVMDKLVASGTKVDCVICDLPYFQVVKNDWDNSWKTVNEYLVWVNKCLVYMSELLKDNSNIILFTSRQYNRNICNQLD